MSAGQKVVWDDGLAGPCMASVHGCFMVAWQRGGLIWWCHLYSGGLLGFNSELAKGVNEWERAVKVS